MEAKPLILVTNDDGFNAPGIEALAEAMQPLGEVYVVAPDVERSASSHRELKDNRRYDDDGVDQQDGREPEHPTAEWDVSHSLNISEALVATPVEGRDTAYQLNGTPADCVYYALMRLLPRVPALVVSGINQGPNLGDDVYRSGTVACAREAAFHGVAAIAFSLAVGKPGWLGRKKPDFLPAARCAGNLARHILERGLPERTFLNVNVPVEVKRDPKVTVLEYPSRGLEDYPPGRTERRTTPRVLPLTDRYAFSLGHISITPLQTDATNYRLWTELDQSLPDLQAESPAIEYEG